MMYTIKNANKRCVVTVVLRSFQRHEQDFIFLCISVAHNHKGKKVFGLRFVIRKEDVELGKFVCCMVGLSLDNPWCHHFLVRGASTDTRSCSDRFITPPDVTPDTASLHVKGGAVDVKRAVLEQC